MSTRLDLFKETRRIRSVKQRHLGTCSSGKVRYRDKSEGIEILKRLQNLATQQEWRYGQTSRQECRVYECGNCQGYHLTSMPLLAAS